MIKEQVQGIGLRIGSSALQTRSSGYIKLALEEDVLSSAAMLLLSMVIGCEISVSNAGASFATFASTCIDWGVSTFTSLCRCERCCSSSSLAYSLALLLVVTADDKDARKRKSRISLMSELGDGEAMAFDQAWLLKCS